MPIDPKQKAVMFIEVFLCVLAGLIAGDLASKLIQQIGGSR